MKCKAVVLALSLLIIISGMLVAVEVEGVNESVDNEPGLEELADSQRPKFIGNNNITNTYDTSHVDETEKWCLEIDKTECSDKTGNRSATGEYEGLEDAATLTIDIRDDQLWINPSKATVIEGEKQEYTALTEEQGEPKDVTQFTTFSIEEGAGGIWSENTYTSGNLGTWTVEGHYKGMTDTAELTVEVGDPDHIEIGPQEKTIITGESVDYHATAFNHHGTEIGDVTGETDWWIEDGAGGSWSENTYTSENLGTLTIEGDYDGMTDGAELTVEVAEPDHIEIGPQEKTVKAGEPVDYHATAFNHHGTEIGDVTGETDWWIEDGAGGSWSGNTYTSEINGTWTVEGDYDGMTDSAELTVEVGDPDHIEIGPQEKTVKAGGSVDYHATAFDDHGNEIGDVTDETDWWIEDGAGGSWSGNTYTSENLGTWTVEGDYDGMTDSAELTVEVGDPDHIEIGPQEKTVKAGESVDYHATAFDDHGNEIGDVTGETDWWIEDGAGGSWSGNTYTSEINGTWTVEGDYDGMTDSAELTVEVGDPDHIEIGPQEKTVKAGESVDYHATAFDDHGNEIGDVTGETDWWIEDGAGGSWSGNTYTSENLGTWTVEGDYDGMTDIAELTVEVGDPDHIEIGPQEKTVKAGESVDYHATAFDDHGNEIGDVTGETDWWIEDGAGGSWSENTYTSEINGTWTVEGDYDGMTNSAELTVEVGDPDHIEIGPQEKTVKAGESVDYHATAFDDHGNEIGDVTGETDWWIEDGAGGIWSGNTYTSEINGTWTVEGDYDGMTNTAELTVEVGDPDHIEIGPQEKTVKAGVSVDYHATAFDDQGNEIGDVTGETDWWIEDGAGGIWSENTYTSEINGTWTVEGDYDGMTDIAELNVSEADLEEIEISPGEEIIEAGEMQGYTATAYDEIGNAFDVTDEINWSIEDSAGGEWGGDGNVYTSEVAGTWKVIGTYVREGEELTDNATLIVKPADVDRIAIEPKEGFNLTAGESENFSASAYDVHDNLVEDAEFGWENASEGGVFKETKVGIYKVTASYDGVTSPMIKVTVEPADVYSVVISLDDDQNVTAGDTLNFSAEAYDGYENLITTDEDAFEWENTSEGGVFKETKVGVYTVVASYENVISSRIEVTVEAAGIDHLKIEPEDETIEAGETIIYYAFVFDEFNNQIEDITVDTNWMIDDGAGGEWRENEYTSEEIGIWTVTGVYIYDEESLTVETKLTVEEELKEYTLMIDVEGEGSTEPEKGIHKYVEGEEVEVEAIADEGWYFVEWTGDHEGTEEQITITMDDNKEVTAVFEEIQTYELAVGVEGKGDVVVEPEREEYEEDTEVTLTAVPDEGWHFVEWTGNHEGTEEKITMIIEDDMHITAVFEEEIEYYELTVNVEGEGTVEVEPEQEYYEEDTEVELTALPEEGWYFVEWTGDYEGDGEENTLNITMNSDINLTAHFEESIGEPIFEIEIIYIDEKIEIGEEITLNYLVENTGDAEGTQEIVFRVGGINVDTVNVTLDAGDDHIGEFSLEAGEARFGRGGEFVFEVIGEDEVDLVSIAVDESSTPSDEGDLFSDYWWLMLIILVLVGVFLLIILLTRKDESTDEEDNTQPRADGVYKGHGNEVFQQSSYVYKADGDISTALMTLGQTTKSRAYEYMTKEKGVPIEYEDFESELEELVRDEKVIRQPRKDGEDLYQWMGE